MPHPSPRQLPQVSIDHKGVAPPAPLKLKRHEKAERNRKLIIDAAAGVIGDYGYAEASISRIMERAGLGHGTFYAYFRSRTDLFDQLLPMKGIEVLDYLGERVRGSRSFIELESRGFVAFLEYVRDHPWFFRLLHESKVAAPQAYGDHLSNVMSRFKRSLKRSWDRGELPGYRKAELDTLASILISARDYVYSPQLLSHLENPDVLAAAAATYSKFLEYGLRGKLA